MFQPGANLYTQGFGSRPENVEVPHYDTRAPTAQDFLYPIGKQWVWSVQQQIWELVQITSTQGVTSAVWIQLTNQSTGANTTYDEDTGTATPIGNVLNVVGGSGVTTSGSGNTITISIQNSQTSTGQTVGATTADLATFDCAPAGTYFFTTQLAAYASGGTPPNQALGVESYATIVSDGATLTAVGDDDAISHMTSGFASASPPPSLSLVVSGTNVIVQVQGIAGYTIDWGAITIYVYRG